MLKKHLLIITLIFSFCFQNSLALPLSIPQHPKHQNQFDNDFKERYSSRKYNYEGREIIGHTPSGHGKIADYKNEKARSKEKNNEDALSMNLGFLDWFFVLALIVAVSYLAYVLLNEGGSGLFSKRQHQKLHEHGDITAENIESTDIQSLINAAENTNDYRLAIRYYYLLVLKTLSLKNLIKIEEDKTNADYLEELSAQPFLKKFSYISYIYNYTWYGEFDVNTEQYHTAKTDFTKLLNSISP
tara:strand:+ start:13771 stop:14499 length:729 start_codon:yes stop_codon:yes gene_type:complete